MTVDGGDFSGQASSYGDSVSGTVSVSDGCFYVTGTETDYEGYSYTDDGQGCIERRARARATSASRTPTS